MPYSNPSGVLQTSALLHVRGSPISENLRYVVVVGSRVGPSTEVILRNDYTGLKLISPKYTEPPMSGSFPERDRPQYLEGLLSVAF